MNLTTLFNNHLFSNRDHTVNVISKIISDNIKMLSNDNNQYITSAHYSNEILSLEHISRLLWGAIPLVNDHPEYLIELRNAVIKHIDSNNNQYWGDLVDYDQRCVEMSAIAVALIDCKSVFFDPLSDSDKEKLFLWLKQCATISIPNNNWHFFRILILTALSLLDNNEYDHVLISDINEIEKMYIDNGWYYDGLNQCVDYYNPFAFHFYSLIFSRWVFTASSNNKLFKFNKNAQQFIRRSIDFFKVFSLWFGNDGSQITYGRSMTYRFASLGFLGELAYFESILLDSNISIESIRSLWQSSLEWWANKDIWQEKSNLELSGLSIGYAYPNLNMAEIYNSPVSTLLALKAFSPLRLDRTSSFWEVKEIKKNNKKASITYLKNLKQVIKNDYDSYLLSGANSAGELRHCDDKYLKFSYSSNHGFCVESLNLINIGFIGDNIFACHLSSNNTWHFRKTLTSSYISNKKLITHWSPFDGCNIKTKQWFSDKGEYREHKIESDTTFKFILSGHAVNTWSKCDSNIKVLNSALIKDENFISDIKIIKGNGYYSIMPCTPNTNIQFAQASVPVVCGEINPGITCFKTFHISKRI